MLVFRSGIGGLAKILAAFGLVVLSAALAGCSTRGGSVPYDVKGFGAPDAPTAQDFTQVYRIGPADVLSVTVYRVPNLSGDLEVDAAGNISMPLIGAVPVQGKTNTEVASDLAQRLGAKYLQSPDVQVVVKASPRMRVTVDGAVNQPGIFPVAGQTSLVQAIALARGLTVDANPRRVVVFRTLNGQRMAAAFDLSDIRRGKMADPVIYGDDIVVVDGSAWRSRFRDFMSSVPLLAIFRPF